ncbi:MAG TPA: NAD(P)-dependent oxidoreductase [Thermomicrobiales bacterium]|nr:NAD(P)-dependent oxidoreductase [Thermomicrobiales bacterium]
MAGTIGVVGLGNMGGGMAANLLKAGFSVAVYDVRPEAAEPLIAAGARRAESLRDLAAACDTALVMVLNFAQVREVVLGADGLAAALAPGSTVIVSSTIAPDEARSLAAPLAGRGLRCLDAPVTGGKSGAEAGTLSIMVGGDREVFDAHQAMLAAMAANIYYCGPLGAGETAKMCNQLMAGVTLMATAECLTLAAAAGMDRRLLYEIITHGAGDCWMFRHRGARLVAGDDEVTSRLDIWPKDLGIVLDTADKLHLPLLLATAARQWAVMGVAAGHGADDDTAVARVMEQFAGVEVKAE